jgi:hypothetical protein
VKERIEGDAVADPQGADALGAVHLVSGDGDEVACGEREGDAAEALDGVAQEQGAPRASEGRDFGDRLDHADLVIHQHCGDDAGAVGDPLGGEIQIDKAVAADREDVDLGADSAQPFGGVEHGGVFRRQSYHAAAFGREAGECALQRPVQRLGGAGGEVEAALPCRRAKSRRHLLARVLHGSGGLAAEAVGAMGVGEFVVEPRAHRGRRLGSERGGGLIVEVDRASCGSLALSQPLPGGGESVDFGCGGLRAEADAHHFARGASVHPIAVSTWLTFIVPEEQALPADTAMPARSNWMSCASEETPGMR